MTARLLATALLLTSALAEAQKVQLTLEEVAARRWTELHTDRITATADGQGITLSDIRRQIDPIVGQIRASVRSDEEFDKAISAAAQETLKSMADRQVVIAEFRSTVGKLPATYIDSDIEDTIRRDFGGDRNRFVASLRASGTTPLAYRKFIEDRIIFEYMAGQIRRSVADVSPGRVLEYYEANKASFERKEQIQIRQITLSQGAAETLEEAKTRATDWARGLRNPSELNALVEKYKLQGPKFVGPVPTFAEIAERISTDDFAKKGGDAGWRNFSDLNERISSVLRGMKNGEVSEAVQFEVAAGKSVWFILLREGYRPKGFAPVTDPDVITEIENKVRAAATQAAVNAWIADLRTKHHVELR